MGKGITMPMSAMPAKNEASTFASMRSDHAAVRIPDFTAGKLWFVEKLAFRLVHEWRDGELQHAYIAPANDDGFFLELIGDGSPTPKSEYADLQDSLRSAGYHHLCLHVDNINETVTELQRREVRIV